MSQTYAIICYTDVLTGLSDEMSPHELNSVQKSIQLYQRYMSSDIITFNIKVLDMEHDELLKLYPKLLMEPVYVPLPSDVGFRSLKCLLTRKSYEILQCNEMFDIFCDIIFRQSQQDPTKHNLCKVYGSLCHRGFVNYIFNYHHQWNMNVLRDYVKLIGSNKDTFLTQIDILSAMSPVDNEYTLYKNGFSPLNVGMICRYCEVMFDSNRFLIATHFKKCDPKSIVQHALNKVKMQDTYDTDCKIEIRTLMFTAGHIYAELNDYNMALQLFEHGNRLTRDTHGIFTNYIENFKAYNAQYGTCVLSSEL